MFSLLFSIFDSQISQSLKQEEDAQSVFKQLADKALPPPAMFLGNANIGNTSPIIQPIVLKPWDQKIADAYDDDEWLGIMHITDQQRVEDLPKSHSSEKDPYIP